jgi:hypothetical protein
VARVLIVEGAGRGLRLAAELIAREHAVRVTTSDPGRRGAVEATGAECRVGTPDRLSTLRGALEHVTIACWLLADASGDPELVQALHGSRLQQFLTSAIDSTLRGFLYEAGGTLVSPGLFAQGEQLVSETAARNSIPVAVLRADPLDRDTWSAQALLAVDSLLEGRGHRTQTRYPDTYTPKS